MKTVLIIAVVLLVGSFLVLATQETPPTEEEIRREEATIIGDMKEEEVKNTEQDIIIDKETPSKEAEESEEELSEAAMDEFVSCLVDQKMIVYASKTCPACTMFAQEFGGYDTVEDLFVLCSQEREKCGNEMKTGFVPEIQIDGELYEGQRDLRLLGEEVECEL